MFTTQSIDFTANRYPKVLRIALVAERAVVVLIAVTPPGARATATVAAARGARVAKRPARVAVVAVRCKMRHFKHTKRFVFSTHKIHFYSPQSPQSLPTKFLLHSHCPLSPHRPFPPAPKVRVILNAQFITLNTQFITFNARFVILNTQFIIFNTQFIIFNGTHCKSSSRCTVHRRRPPGSSLARRRYSAPACHGVG